MKKGQELISESRLKEIILEEGLRFKRRLTLESEKKQLLKKLNEMYSDDEEDEVVDEAFLGMFKSPEEKAASLAQKAADLAKKVPEAIVKGTAIATANPGKVKVHNILPKEQRQKFLMFLGFNPNVKYQAWDASLTAPDGTPGYFKDSAVTSISGGGQETGL